jgi:hypothetical protein
MIDQIPVYIHLGLHKTASTFFQRKFYPNHHEFNYLHLRDKNTLGAFNQYVLRENDLFFKEEKAIEFFYQNLDQEKLYNEKRITLCEEQFSGFPLLDAYNRKRIFDRLHLIFPKAKYILVLRNQRDFIISMYAEYLKKGGQESFTNFLSVSNTHLNFSRGTYLHYYKYYDYISSVVGINNIQILYYEDLIDTPKYFFEIILNYFEVDFDIDLSILNRKENVSFSSSEYEKVRFLNRFCKTPYSPNHLLNRKKIKILNAIIPFFLEKEKYELVVDDYINKINFSNELLPEYNRIKKYGY